MPSRRDTSIGPAPVRTVHRPGAATSAVGRVGVGRWRVPAVWALWLVLNSAMPAWAQTDAGRPPYSDVDWVMLPEWCIDTQDGPYGSPSYSGGSSVGKSKSPRSDRWTAVFGGDFWHMHHHCRALYAERQLGRGDLIPKERVAKVSVAIGDYLYLVLKCKPTNPLMPEVYFRLGELYLRRGDRVMAADAFDRSRKLKPDYWPAYTSWVDELVRLRLFDTARKLIDEGLLYAPGNPQLLESQQRIAKLTKAPRLRQPVATRAGAAAQRGASAASSP
jgi:hypothetical protein